MPKFVEKFLRTPHHPVIKAIVSKDDGLLAPVRSIFLGFPAAARTSLSNIFAMAASAGRDWARSFTKELDKLEKTGQKKPPRRNEISIDLSRDVENSIKTIGDRATKLMLGPAGNKIKKSDLYMHGKQVVRLRAVEAYIKAALTEWASRGIAHCKRVELDDVKTCPVCIHLNTKEYVIRDLLKLDNPLTNDTHANCRGAFIPIINDISKVYEAFNEQPVTFDMNTKNVKITGAPIEYRPWLEQFFSRVSPTFEINFDRDITADYVLKDGELLINPKALHDEDPREIITEAMAKSVPAVVKRKTIKDYRALLELGVVRPPVDTDDDDVLFTELYQQYLLNQLDDLMEVVYFKTFFDGTRYGKNRV